MIRLQRIVLAPACLLAACLLAACLLAACVDSPPRVPDIPGHDHGATPVAAEPGTTPDGGMDPVPSVPPAITADGPKLAFTANGHDYGRQEKNTKVSHTAVFFNVGRQPLVITGVETHCGCAAALLSAKEIPPGGRGTLKVTLETGRLGGRRQKTVEVFTNDPVEPVSKYPISCDVVADAALDPIVLVVRATRSEGDIEAHFDVLSLRPGFDLKITEIVTSNPNLTSAIGPLPPGTPGVGYRVTLSIGPDFGSRDFSERVTVYTNSQRDRSLTLNVLGSVRQAVLVVPERLYFPRLTGGSEVKRTLYVYRNDGKPLGITSVEDASGYFETSAKRVEPGKWQVEVSITGEAPARTVRGSLVIFTDEPAEPRVTVPFEVPGGEDR